MSELFQTFLYAADVSEFSNTELYVAALSSVSEQRKRKMNRLRFEKDRFLSLGGELILLRLISHFGIDIGIPEFAYGDNGKPFFKERPNVIFNISHSGDYVLCAVSSRNIGCDIEIIEKSNLKIAKRFFTENEYNRILSFSSDAKKNNEFLRLWTLKESFIKATGKGFSVPLDSFDISFQDDIPSPIIFEGKTYSFSEICDVEGYKISFCEETEKMNFVFKKVSISEII